MRIRLFVLLLILLAGCKKDESTDHSDIPEDLRPFIERFHIDKPGVRFDRVVYEEDKWYNAYKIPDGGNILFISGYRGDGVWLGAYDNYTKEELWDWTEPFPIEKTFVLHNGKEIKIDRHDVGVACKSGEYYAINIRDMIAVQGDNLFAVLQTHLYFIGPDGITHKESGGFYGLDGEREQVDDVVPWHEGHFLVLKNILNSDFEMECYSVKGKKIYSSWVEIDDWFRMDYLALNLYEGIKVDRNDHYCFIRRNLQTGDIIWTSKALVPDLEQKAKELGTNCTLLLEKEIDKSVEGFWICSFKCILGDVLTVHREIRLNVDTGEFTFKDR